MSEPKTDILYPLICSWGNLLSAYAKAAAGKRGRKPAADFEYKLEDNLLARVV
jgi:hypothetical protein